MKLYITLLTLASFACAAPASPNHHLIFRAEPVPASGTSANGWTSMGCWQDGTPRLLGSNRNSPKQTQESCQATCAGWGYTYAGLKRGTACYCDNLLNTAGGAALTQDSACDTGCAGDSDENCGGHNALVLFKSG